MSLKAFRGWMVVWVAGWAAAGLAGAQAPAQRQPDSKPQVIFTDVTKDLGIHWTHVNGATPEKYLIETMGGGAAFLNYNQDGLLDIFFVNSGCHKYSVNCTSSGNALYRQERDGTFTDVTREAGLAGSPNYGMGVAVGDFDNDGHPDIYITGFPRNVLGHNNRNGTFTGVTDKSGRFSWRMWWQEQATAVLLIRGCCLDWDKRKKLMVCGFSGQVAW